MDVSSSWTAHDWMNRGGELLDPDPWLAQRLLARGLQLDPTEAIAWFNLGIGLHQQRRIAAAVRAYRHCLALPHSKVTEQAARNNLAQDLLLLGHWQEGWGHYAQRFARKPGNHPSFERLFGPSHRGPLKLERPVLLMSEQGFGDTLQFSRYALHLQQQGFDVTLLSQPALVPLLRDAMGLQQVLGQLESEYWAERQPIWLPLLDLLPVLRLKNYGLHSAVAIYRLRKRESNAGHPCCMEARATTHRSALARNPSHEHSLYPGMPFPSNNS